MTANINPDLKVFDGSDPPNAQIMIRSQLFRDEIDNEKTIQSDIPIELADKETKEHELIPIEEENSSRICDDIGENNQLGQISRPGDEVKEAFTESGHDNTVQEENYKLEHCTFKDYEYLNYLSEGDEFLNIELAIIEINANYNAKEGYFPENSFIYFRQYCRIDKHILYYDRDRVVRNFAPALDGQEWVFDSSGRGISYYSENSRKRLEINENYIQMKDMPYVGCIEIRRNELELSKIEIKLDFIVFLMVGTDEHSDVIESFGYSNCLSGTKPEYKSKASKIRKNEVNLPSWSQNDPIANQCHYAVFIPGSHSKTSPKLIKIPNYINDRKEFRRKVSEFHSKMENSNLTFE